MSSFCSRLYFRASFPLATIQNASSFCYYSLFLQLFNKTFSFIFYVLLNCIWILIEYIFFLEKIKLEARDEKNSLSQTIPSVPVHLDIFRKLCEQRRKFPVLYKLEFSTAAKIETNTSRHAMRRNNHSKNQNPKCIPFDYNRIVLEKIPGVPDSDYINASYVDVSILLNNF